MWLPKTKRKQKQLGHKTDVEQVILILMPEISLYFCSLYPRGISNKLKSQHNLKKKKNVYKVIGVNKRVVIPKIKAVVLKFFPGPN
jgi:hypothetical protein